MNNMTEQQIKEQRKFGPLFEELERLREENDQLKKGLAPFFGKSECLELIKLLSALESWVFSTQARVPDYLFERIELALDKLTAEVLSGG